jgi:hypothetical protein
MKKITIIITGLLFWQLGICQQYDNEVLKNTLENTERTIVSTIDLNYDNVIDTLVFIKNKERDEPGDWHALEIKLSGLKDITFEDNLGWIIQSNTPNNLLAHKYANLINLSSSQRALIIKSYPYASIPKLHTVLIFSKNINAEVAFKENINNIEFADINGDNTLDIACKNSNRLTDIYILNNALFTLDKERSLKVNLEKRAYRKFPEVSVQLFIRKDLENYSSFDLQLMLNEIYADYGLIFTNATQTEYFNSQSWYKPKYTMDIVNNRLNSIERQNIALIKEKIDPASKQ